MKIIIMILGYLRWHYGKAILALSRIWKNFIYFVFTFFSIRLLFKNFFDPWKRMSDGYPHNFNLKKYFYAFLTNLIVRMVGMIMRAALILIGFFCLLIMILLYPLVIISWFILPFFVIFTAGLGLFLIIK
jgi:hypothetical protein